MKKPFKSWVPPITITRNRNLTISSSSYQSVVRKDYDYEVAIDSATDELSLAGYFQLDRPVKSKGNDLAYTPKVKPVDVASTSVVSYNSSEPIPIPSASARNMNCCEFGEPVICEYQTTIISARLKKPALQRFPHIYNNQERDARIQARKLLPGIQWSPSSPESYPPESGIARPPITLHPRG